MREATSGLPDGIGSLGGSVVAMPNLMSGELAELLAAAAGPAQEHELRGEFAARTAYRSAVASWPVRRRRFVRTPAAVAVSTMATLLVASTGLAAAADLPGPAGRTAQGVLGAVGVHVGPSAPAAPVASNPSPGSSGNAATGVTARAGLAPTRCASSTTTGPAQQLTACTVHALRPTSSAHVAASTAPIGAQAVPAKRLGHPSARPLRLAPEAGPAVSKAPRNPTTPATTPTTTPTTDPTAIGGGTTRGGNIGTGGTCDSEAGTGGGDSSATSTNSTAPSTGGAGAPGAPSTIDGATTSAVTGSTDPSAVDASTINAAGCTHKGTGHHHAHTPGTTTSQGGTGPHAPADVADPGTPPATAP